MIILNGELTEKNKINLDSGFFFGIGVFETILVLNRKPVFLEQHLERLNNALKKLNINIQIKDFYVLENINKLQCIDCAVKLVVSKENIIFTKRDIPYKNEDYEKGFSVVVSSIKRNPYSYITYLKSLNYTENILERENALKKGYNEAIFLNTEDYLSEGSISNIFFIKNDKIYTPSVDCGLLNGVIRKWIISNYEVQEGKFTLEELINSDGVFLTNSLMGIMKVMEIGKTKIKHSNLLEDIRRRLAKYI